MARLGTIVLSCGLLAVWSGVAAGQAMLEHMSAAAGGSVAGVAGKTVSDGIDKVFGKLGKTLEKADVPDKKDVKAKAKASTSPAKGEAAEPTGAPPTFQRGQRVRPVYGAPEPAAEPVPMPVIVRKAQPERPHVTPAQIAQVQTGAVRDEVLAKLGRPSARITIPEDGRLLEIYQYTDNGKVTGALRLTDGVVSSVRVDQR